MATGLFHRHPELGAHHLILWELTPMGNEEVEDQEHATSTN